MKYAVWEIYIRSRCLRDSLILYVVIAREAYSVNALLGIRRVYNERAAMTILFTCICTLNALHGCAFITQRSALCVICIIDIET